MGRKKERNGYEEEGPSPSLCPSASQNTNNKHPTRQLSRLIRSSPLREGKEGGERTFKLAATELF